MAVEQVGEGAGSAVRDVGQGARGAVQQVGVLLGHGGVEARGSDPAQSLADVIGGSRFDAEVVEPTARAGVSMSTSFSGGSAMTKLA